MEIQLTQGKVTTIDDKHADLIAFNWCAKKGNKTVYAQRSVRNPDGTRTTVALHQVIARRMGIVGPPDHVDRNGLNNRESNLRPDPRDLNSANRDRQANNTSGVKGVSWGSRQNKWRAYVRSNGKLRHLGYFLSPVQAALAYDRAALAAFGEFSRINFKLDPRTEAIARQLRLYTNTLSII